MKSDFLAPRVNICCYLLEVAISKTRSKTGEIFSAVDLRSNFFILWKVPRF
jgi:hypothetical protein